MSSEDLASTTTDSFVPDRHTAVLVFLHGSHDTRYRWEKWFANSPLKNLHRLCIVTPMSDRRHVVNSIYGNGMKRSWRSTVYSFDADDARLVTCFGARVESDSQNAHLSHLLEQFAALTPQVFIGGFSQGATMSMYTALHTRAPLAGIILLAPGAFNCTRYRDVDTLDQLLAITAETDAHNVPSHAFMPIAGAHRWGNDSNRRAPILLMIGDDDYIQDEREKADTETYLSAMCNGREIRFTRYPGLKHTANDTVLSDMATFITQHSPSLVNSNM